MTRALLAAAIMLAAIPGAAQARPGCAWPHASAAGCAGCQVTLKGSAFGDTNPKADGVGLTVGDTATMRLSVRGCRLPAGAHLQLRVQRLDPFGHPAGKAQRHDCATGHRSCVVRATRSTSGSFAMQAFLVGCAGTHKSRVVGVVWAPKDKGGAGKPGGGTGGGGTGGGGTAPSVVMTFSRVTADGNYVNASCAAANPPGLSGHEELHAPGYDHVYDWTLPATISAGNSATVHVSVTSKHNGSESAQIAFKPPSEVGSSEGLFAVQVIADPNSSKADGKTTTFHPTRAFTVGEKLYIRLETGCASWIYEYVGK